LAHRLIVGPGWRDGWRGVVRIGLETLSDVLACVLWGDEGRSSRLLRLSAALRWSFIR